MSDVARYFGSLFELQNVLAQSGVAGFTPEIWSERPSGANHPTWILAHVTAVRRTLARNLGAGIPQAGWEEQVVKAEPSLEAGRYPAPESLLEEFLALGQDIAGRLRVGEEAVLAARYQPTLPDGVERSVEEALGVLITHEALHLGQLSYVRRLHGLEGLSQVALKALAAGSN